MSGTRPDRSLLPPLILWDFQIDQSMFAVVADRASPVWSIWLALLRSLSTILS